MATPIRPRTVRKRPTMAVTLRDMATPGEEIRRARRAQGLSQEGLARLARVSAKTIGRIERGQDYDDPRSLPAIRAALGLDRPTVDLTRVSAESLAAEIVRRLVAAETVLHDQRIAAGDAPTDLIHRPGTIAGPLADQSGHANEADG